MGFLLHFTRALQVKSQQNRINLEMVLIANKQTAIANRLSALEQMGAVVDKDNPGIKMLELTKQMLISMNNALDLRLKSLQTRAQMLANEEMALDKALPEAIAKSAPKYCG